MKRTARDNRENMPAPVRRIELSEKNKKARLAFFIIFLVIGISCLVYFAVSYFIPSPGWEIVGTDGAGVSPADGIVLSYCFGKKDSKAFRRDLAAFYGEVSAYAEKLFDASEEYPGVNNVCYINAHPGEEIEVSSVLYDAFELLKDTRYLYLAPVYEHYENTFSALDDVSARAYDPVTDPAAKELCAQAFLLASDPGNVRLELLGNGRIRLIVSEDYRAFIEKNEYRYIDFFWLGNAFAADYAADQLIAAGYTKGIVSSPDGFARNLDAGGGYAADVQDLHDGAVYTACRMNYGGRTAMVRFRNFGPSGRFLRNYGDGEFRTPFINPGTGVEKGSPDSLLAYSRKEGCAVIAVRAFPAYVSDPVDVEALSALKDAGIFSVFCDGTVVRYNDESAEIIPGEYEGRKYTAELF